MQLRQTILACSCWPPPSSSLQLHKVLRMWAHSCHAYIIFRSPPDTIPSVSTYALWSSRCTILTIYYLVAARGLAMPLPCDTFRCVYHAWAEHPTPIPVCSTVLVLVVGLETPNPLSFTPVAVESRNCCVPSSPSKLRPFGPVAIIKGQTGGQ